MVGNLTGPMMDGAPVLPQFPVTTPLTFQNSHLLVQLNNGQTPNIALGNIGPGLFDDPSGLLKFPDTTEFQSATFTATLSQTHLTLLDGHPFDATPHISTLLLPSTGNTLQPETDFTIIEVSPVPVPPSLLLMGSALVGLGMILAQRRGRITNG